jgi:glycerophosphoryl diester phosphodiesterase
MSNEEFVVIEEFLQAKSFDPERCEDVLVITDHFAAIVDGATSKSARSAECIAPGRLLAQVLAKAVQEWHPSITARSAVDHLTALAQEFNDRQAKSDEELGSASVIILSLARREVWRVGDCLLLIGRKEYPPKNELEQSIASVRAAYNQITLRSGTTVTDLQQRDLGRELVLPLLKTQNALANVAGESRFAFGVLNGVAVPDAHLEIVTLQSGSYDIVLCSDGYPRAFASLHEAETELTAALTADPLCITEIVATKGKGIGDASYDDRAYVRLRCELTR